VLLTFKPFKDAYEEAYHWLVGVLVIWPWDGKIAKNLGHF
jgi:hypothetical protein